MNILIILLTLVIYLTPGVLMYIGDKKANKYLDKEYEEDYFDYGDCPPW